MSRLSALTFHYSAIKPEQCDECFVELYRLTFHYSAIKLIHKSSEDDSRPN